VFIILIVLFSAVFPSAKLCFLIDGLFHSSKLNLFFKNDTGLIKRHIPCVICFNTTDEQIVITALSSATVINAVLVLCVT